MIYNKKCLKEENKMDSNFVEVCFDEPGAYTLKNSILKNNKITIFDKNFTTGEYHKY